MRLAAPSGTGGRSSPVRVGEVRDERRLARGDRHHARPAAPHARPAATIPSIELRRLEQLIEVVAADDAGRVERRIGHPVLAGQAAAVGDRGGLRLAATGPP